LNPALHTSPGGRLQGSAWGTANLQRSLPEDWSALAKVVQQPTCELVREGQRTYLQLRLPGVRTRGPFIKPAIGNPNPTVGRHRLPAGRKTVRPGPR
jgi:hypothetical protein